MTVLAGPRLLWAQMAERSTWGEASAPDAEPVAVLTIVLSYDDLLADVGRSFRLDGAGETIIGRAEGSTDTVAERDRLLLPDNWVSTRHATLRAKAGGAFFLEDRESRNGTFVNGQKIAGRERIFDGDLLEIGHTLLCFRHVPEPALRALLDPAGLRRIGPTPTRCPELVALVDGLERVAPSRQSVLILGETGAGKEVVARAVHERSGRSGDLCAVDCGAVPESLFEGTFFGHRRGAFTGAAEPRAGEIVRADGGTLFLDELANMTPACQAKLLRVIEEGKVTPLGATDAQRVDVRWIAATNADPFARGSSFRLDLVQRLAGFVARVPPLRRRREDLGALAAHFLREAGLTRASITGPAGRRLFADPLPGNARQLRAMLQTAAILAGGGPIDVAHIPLTNPEADPSGDADETARERPSRTSSKPLAIAPDRGTLEAALAQTGGNVIRAAALLDARPRQLYRWIERFDLPLDKYRGSVSS